MGQEQTSKATTVGQSRPIGLVIVALFIFAGPLCGLLVSAAQRRNVNAEFASHGYQVLSTVCKGDDVGQFEGVSYLCERAASGQGLLKLSLALLVITILVPSLYAALTYLIGRDRGLVVRWFRWVMRPAMAALAIVLLLQGGLMVYALGVGGDALVSVLVLWIGCAALGYGWVAFLILLEAFRPWPIPPVEALGVVLGPDQMPELRSRVTEIAERLGARPPGRIVIGLEPRGFVTAAPLNLHGHGLLPGAETLYLPTTALRVLDGPQLDALLGHELGHFRGNDLKFTQGFAPSLVAMAAAIDNLAPESGVLDGLGFQFAKYPAIWLLQGMALVLGRSIARTQRARELEADRAAVEVSSTPAVAMTLAKMTLLPLVWKAFRSLNGKYLGSGRARSNLSSDYLVSLQRALKVDPSKLHRAVLRSRISHPLDMHPVLSERLAALGADPGVVVDEVMREIVQLQPVLPQLRELEMAITSVENEWMRVPGLPITVDDTDSDGSWAPVRLGSRDPQNGPNGAAQLSVAGSSPGP